MVIISGQQMCGRVDQVPNTCHVATRFFHVYYVPLIPISSWVILHGTENSAGFKGRQIRLSAKSILFGWAQAFLIIFGFYSLIAGSFQISKPQLAANQQINGTLSVVLGVLCLAVWLLFRIRPLHAGLRRANELKRHLGLEVEPDNNEAEWA